jgi:predicted nucleic acid-binding Zn ribbon protein
MLGQKLISAQLYPEGSGFYVNDYPSASEEKKKEKRRIRKGKESEEKR